MPFPTESNGAEAVIEREDDMLKMIPKVLLLAGLLAVVAAVQGHAQQTTKLRLAVVPAAPALAVWVAQDKGFFAAQHLDVAITPMANVALIPAVLGNQFDIGTATTVDLIKAAAGGMNVVAIAANHFETDQAATNALVIRKDSGVRSAKDLAGKTVATPSIGAILHVATLYWIKKEGVDPNTVHFVEVPFPNIPASCQPLACNALDVRSELGAGESADGCEMDSSTRASRTLHRRGADGGARDPRQVHEVTRAGGRSTGDAAFRDEAAEKRSRCVDQGPRRPRSSPRAGRLRRIALKDAVGTVS
jgi:hypothetical protein